MSADLLYNPYKWYGQQTPQKNVSKIPPKKFRDKAVQFDMLWLNLNTVNGIGILQSAHKQGNPSFHFHAPGSKRRSPSTQTASAVPKYFPRLLQFCTGYCIWHASRVWKRKTSEEMLIFMELKISKFKQEFSLFSDEFLSVDLWPVYCSLTCACIQMMFTCTLCPRLRLCCPASVTWIWPHMGLLQIFGIHCGPSALETCNIYSTRSLLLCITTRSWSLIHTPISL